MARSSARLPDGGRPVGRSRRAGGVAFAAVLIAWLIAFAFLIRSDFMDDAFIGFTYARNLAGGEGLTFHPHWAPVEGITNLGWILALSGLGTLFPLPAAAKALGGFLILATLWLSWRASAGTRSSAPVIRAAPLVLLASSFEYLFFSLSGMETAFLSAILVGMAVVASAKPRSWGIPFLGALAFLVRPEAALVAGLYLIGLPVLDKGSRKAALARALVFGGLVGLASLGRWLHFGSLLPNTFIAKPSGLQAVADNFRNSVHPLNTILPHPLTLVAIPLVLLGGWIAIKRERAAGLMLSAVAGAGLAFAFYAPEDWTGLCRYLSPYLPAFYLLLCSGLVFAVEAIWRRGKIRVSSSLAITVLIFAIVLAQGFYLAQFLLSPERELYPGYVLTSRTLVEPSKWMKENLPPGAVIATKRIGAVSYFSELPVFDFKFGLTDARVARLSRRAGKRFESPNAPELKDLWEEVNPEFLLEDEQELNAIARESGGSLKSFIIQGLEFGEVKRFRIAPGVDWVLARRLPR